MAMSGGGAGGEGGEGGGGGGGGGEGEGGGGEGEGGGGEGGGGDDADAGLVIVYVHNMPPKSKSNPENVIEKPSSVNVPAQTLPHPWLTLSAALRVVLCTVVEPCMNETAIPVDQPRQSRTTESVAPRLPE